MVVSGGSKMTEYSMSSNPATETSPGTLKPAFFTSVTKPIAIWSFPANTAVGRLALAKIPPGRGDPAAEIEIPFPDQFRVHLQRRRPSMLPCILRSAPALRCCLAGPLMWAMRRWPMPIRYETICRAALRSSTSKTGRSVYARLSRCTPGRSERRGGSAPRPLVVGNAAREQDRAGELPVAERAGIVPFLLPASAQVADDHAIAGLGQEVG